MRRGGEAGFKRCKEGLGYREAAGGRLDSNGVHFFALFVEKQEIVKNDCRT
jgi:hypothetical protein